VWKMARSTPRAVWSICHSPILHATLPCPARWVRRPLRCHSFPHCARHITGWPKGRAHAPGQAGRCDSERACGRLDHRRIHEGKQHGEGQTPSEEAEEHGPTMRVVRQSRARRSRHSDLPGQGAVHVPCRVSLQIPRRHVAASGAVVTTACAPSQDAGYQPCAGISSSEVLRANNASTTACVHGATMSIPT
jgi:hypothetical protein